jgi:uncharacterized membrane protein YeaQ/YmgE (transglycosylase-associated protein family)
LGLWEHSWEAVFFDFFKIDISGMIASLIMATAGAILVLAIAGLINKN